MNETQRDNWKYEVLNELLLALGKDREIRNALVFKGALILNRLLGAQRKSLDIDSNLDAVFARRHPDREAQKNFLEEHLSRAISRYFESKDPVRYELKNLRVDANPKDGHPLGWDGFLATVSLIDHANLGTRGLPSLTIDVSAPETLSEASVADMELEGVSIRAYTLERIAGEKARAFLSTLPAYRAKVRKPGEAVRVKDLYDLSKIIRFRPITRKDFWTAAGLEFRIACESRSIDCRGKESFFENWKETKELYQKDPTIPVDVKFAEAEETVDSILSIWSALGIIPFSFPLP
ncbi:MAG: nucleotidyl transferase AbiEii/AbiGii toxin family protein [Thermodesulfobacteriota bacterium]